MEIESRVYKDPFGELRWGSLDLVQAHLGHDLVSGLVFRWQLNGMQVAVIVKDEQLKQKLREFWIGLLRSMVLHRHVWTMLLWESLCSCA